MSSPPEQKTSARWQRIRITRSQFLMTAAAVLLAVAIVGGVLASRSERDLPGVPGDGSSPQLCLSDEAQGALTLKRAKGCITYTDGEHIWAVDPNHPANRLSLGPAAGMTPIAWSRDGQRLLLRWLVPSPDEWAPDLYVMNMDGTRTRLTNDGRGYAGAFSPDGTKVVFAKLDRGIYVVGADGSSPTLIARSYIAWWLESPAWSPDGLRIAYAVYLEGGPRGLTYEIWTMNPDGSDSRQLIDLGACGGGGCTGGLAWSPDGSTLAFHAQRGVCQNPCATLPPTEIYVVKADGTGLRAITHGGGLSPSWSPDGSRIAFTRGSSLMTMKPDGTATTEVKRVFPAGFGYCAWNPVS